MILDVTELPRIGVNQMLRLYRDRCLLRSSLLFDGWEEGFFRFWNILDVLPPAGSSGHVCVWSFSQSFEPCSLFMYESCPAWLERLVSF